MHIGFGGVLPRSGGKTGRRHRGVQRSSSCGASRGERPAGVRPERDAQARAGAAASPGRALRAASRTPRRATTGSRRSRRELIGPQTADVKSKTTLYRCPQLRIKFLLHIHNIIVRTLGLFVKVTKKNLVRRRHICKYQF